MRDNRFSRLDRIFEDMVSDLNKMSDARHTPIAEQTARQEYEGYRKEVVDGETTEYYLEDGEWHEVGDESSYEVDGNSFTIDLSAEVRGFTGVASATLNNGVLSVEFE